MVRDGWCPARFLLAMLCVVCVSNLVESSSPCPACPALPCPALRCTVSCTWPQQVFASDRMAGTFRQPQPCGDGAPASRVCWKATSQKPRRPPAERLSVVGPQPVPTPTLATTTTTNPTPVRPQAGRLGQTQTQVTVTMPSGPKPRSKSLHHWRRLMTGSPSSPAIGRPGRNARGACRRHRSRTCPQVGRRTPQCAVVLAAWASMTSGDNKATAATGSPPVVARRATCACPMRWMRSRHPSGTAVDDPHPMPPALVRVRVRVRRGVKPEWPPITAPETVAGKLHLARVRNNHSSNNSHSNSDSHSNGNNVVRPPAGDANATPTLAGAGAGAGAVGSTPEAPLRGVVVAVAVAVAAQVCGRTCGYACRPRPPTRLGLSPPPRSPRRHPATRRPSAVRSLRVFRAPPCPCPCPCPDQLQPLGVPRRTSNSRSRPTRRCMVRRGRADRSNRRTTWHPRQRRRGFARRLLLRIHRTPGA